MIITTVEYGRLVNLGNYENEKLSATAQVEEDETPHAALECLRKWVDGEASSRKAALGDIEAIQNRLSSLRYENTEMERQLNIMSDTWSKARKFLDTAGLDLPEPYGLHDQTTELPF